MSARERSTPIGCGGHTHLIIVQRRYLRWRCTDRRCPDVQEAIRRGKGEWTYHVHDLETGAQWPEWEPAIVSEQRAA